MAPFLALAGSDYRDNSINPMLCGIAGLTLGSWEQDVELLVIWIERVDVY